MAFKILLKLAPDEEPVLVHTITDQRVTRVGLNGRFGEAGAMGIDPNQTEVVLTFDYASTTGVPTLHDLEALQHPTMTGDEAEERKQMLAELPSAQNTGVDAFSHDMVDSRESDPASPQAPTANVDPDEQAERGDDLENRTENDPAANTPDIDFGNGNDQGTYTEAEPVADSEPVTTEAEPVADSEPVTTEAEPVADSEPVTDPVI